MSMCYYLGAKEVTSKKNGKVFFPATFLAKDSWGNWATMTKFCESADVYEDIIQNCEIGSPVVCSLDMSGNLVKAVPHDTVPALQLADD